jgi:predicted transposase/invertase (TIGR01784 family)
MSSSAASASNVSAVSVTSASAPASASAKTSTGSPSVSGPLPYRLTNDYLFRALLQKRRDILKGLLCALLSLKPEEIKDLNILNPIILGESISDKRPVLDISLCMNDNTLIDIEMQVRDLNDWANRSLYYLCKEISNGLQKNEDYSDMKKAVQIGILDFALFPERKHELYSEFLFMNRHTHEIYNDSARIFVLCLPYLKNCTEAEKKDPVYDFARLFAATTWEELTMLAEENDAMKNVHVVLKELTDNEKIQQQLEIEERYERDMSAATRLGREEGREEGKEEGMKNELSLNLSLINAGRTDDIVKAAKDPAFHKQLLKEFGLDKD